MTDLYKAVTEILEKLIDSEVNREREEKAGMTRRDGGRALCIASRAREIEALLETEIAPFRLSAAEAREAAAKEAAVQKLRGGIYVCFRCGKEALATFLTDAVPSEGAFVKVNGIAYTVSRLYYDYQGVGFAPTAFVELALLDTEWFRENVLS